MNCRGGTYCSQYVISNCSTLQREVLILDYNVCPGVLCALQLDNT